MPKCSLRNGHLCLTKTPRTSYKRRAKHFETSVLHWDWCSADENAFFRDNSIFILQFSVRTLPLKGGIGSLGVLQRGTAAPPLIMKPYTLKQSLLAHFSAEYWDSQSRLNIERFKRMTKLVILKTAMRPGTYRASETSCSLTRTRFFVFVIILQAPLFAQVLVLFAMIRCLVSGTKVNS